MVHRSAAALLASTALVVPALPAFAQVLPTSGSVASGSAVITSPSGTGVLVTQSSPNAIINWGSFSIGAGNTVRFENGSGATLNRVTGLSPSQINGSLSASGSLYLVNPNGITVGPSGRITTGGSFVASTHDISDAAFNAGGDLTFRGASTASVINYGSIGALGGDVALIARRVENAGTITAPNGTVALAAGYEVLVRDAALSDGKFVVKVGGADTEVKTSGIIKAAEVELKANGGNVYALAGNTESITKATGVTSKGGRVFLTAGDGGSVTVSQKVVARAATSNGKAKGGEIRVSGGKVKVSGTLDAKGDGDAGGAVTVTGSDLTLASGAVVDVSGASAGGTVRIGGDVQGGGTLAHAQTVVIEAGSVINADATNTGTGGSVVVWSDGVTNFAGTISANGGALGGDGGFVETSGHKLGFGAGLQVTTTAANGATGTWLLDPYNVTISNAADSFVSVDTISSPNTATPSGGSGTNLNVAPLQSALASNNMVVLTSGAGSEAGNITVVDAVTWSANTTLTLNANTSTGGIFLNANVTGTGSGSGLVLNAGAGGINQSVASPTTTASSITVNTLNATATNGGSVALTNSVNAITTLGTSSASGSFALTNGQDLNVSGPITSNGTLSLVTTTGDLNITAALSDSQAGASYTLSAANALNISKDLTLSGSGAQLSLSAGISYSLLSGARVSLPDSGASLSINGTSYTLIHDVTALQSMSSSGNFALGNDIDASATASWNGGAGFNPIGSSTIFSGTFSGLGHNIDSLTINRPGTTFIGLFAQADGATLRDMTLSNVSVSGGARVGALVGQVNNSSLSNIHVTGSVTGFQEAGGIAGWLSDTTLSNASSAASVTVSSNGAGGLVGYALYTVTISDSYATGAVTAASNAGGLVGQALGGPLTLTKVYASGSVTGASSVGGLIGFMDQGPAALTNAYWDANSTGQAAAVGTLSSSTVTGTAVDVSGAPRTQATYAGLDFTNTWVMIDGDTRPMLRNEYSTVIATPAALQLMVLDLSAGYTLGADIDMASAQALGSNGYYSGLWGASGFVPVGTQLPVDSRFTGTFDGQGHTISGLTINRGSSEEVGLFGYTFGATVTNVALSGGSITGGAYVGSLIGVMDNSAVSSASSSATVSSPGVVHPTVGGLIGRFIGGTISDSFATGDVTAAGQYAGGLVGDMSGAATITRSYATGNVTSTSLVGGYVGGLVGNAGTSTTISQSYATGTVTGADGPIGGFVGFNDGAITDSYATGRVNGAGVTYVGGFVGLNFTNGTITNAYSTGYVTGASGVGGFAGVNSGPFSAFTNVYWNTQTSGLSVGVGGGSGSPTARTTAQLQGSLPAGFSSSIWGTGTNLYPYLGWRYSTTPIAVSGVAYSDAGTTALAGVTVTAVSGGSAIGSGSSGANGYYYILAAASGLSSSGVLTYLDNGTAKGAAFSDVAGTNGVQNVTIYGTAANVITGQSTLTATRTNYLATRGSYTDTDLSFLSSSSFTPLTTTAGYGVYLNTSGNYTLNASLGSSGLLTIDSGGTFGVSGAITLSAGGALTIADAVSWSDASSLSLSTTAGGNIGLGGAVTGTIGTLIVNASGTATTSSAIDMGTFNLTSGTWRQITATLPSFAAKNFVIGSSATFLRATGGDGSAATPYQIEDLYGLQGVGSAGLLSQNFVLTADINATPSVIWNASAGFAPIGSSATTFTGSLDGGGHTIGGLTIHRPAGAAGLFDYIGVGGSVSNLTVAGVVTGVDAGMIAAFNSGTITNVTAYGSVGNTGASTYGSIGGAVGQNSGTITGSTSAATVSATGVDGSYAGGLVGYNYLSSSIIANSSASGTVSATTSVGSSAGGLAGLNAGVISGSFATGNVASGYNSGGLVGNNNGGSVSNSFATGSVSGFYQGGLLGFLSGTVTDTYATGSVSGSNGYYSGGLVGYSDGTINSSYATGAASTGVYVGGLVGYNNFGTIVDSFWNTTTSGNALGVAGGPDSGAVGLTATQMTNLATFTNVGWSIDDAGGTSSVWRIYDGYTMPLLRSFMASLTVTGGSGSKTYDGLATSADVGTLVYSPSGYDTSLVSGTAGYTASSADAGSYTGADLSLSGLYSSQFGYDISFVSGSLTVAQAGLTVTANDAGKTYDGAAYSGGNGVTYSGFVGSDTSSSLGGTLAYGGTSQGAVNAGTYSITASGLTSTNYGITYAAGTLTVGTAALTVTANDAGKTYDGAAYSGGNGVTYSGLVGSDTSSSLGGTLAYGGTSQGAVNAGTYSITASGLTSGNYDITYAPGTLTVGTAALTITANNASKVYDATAYSGGNGVSYSGFVGSDSSSSLGGTLAYGGTSQGAVNAGSYSITASGLTSGNYDITYAPGTLTLSPAALTVTADAATMLYGNGLPTFTYVATGTLYSGDTLTGALASLASSTSNVGAYAITQGTLAASSNYAITYVSANIAVTPRSLSVAAAGQSMVYGDSAPTLTYTVGGAGLVNGDTLSGALATTASSNSNVGVYVITQGTLAASSNYTLSYTGAEIVVSPRPLIVTADNASRPANVANPAFTYTIGGLGLANGDLLTGALTSDATISSLPGRYAILQGTLTASSNYALTYVPGELTVIGSTQNTDFVETSVPDQVVVTLETDGLIAVIDRLETPSENTPAPRLTACGGSSTAGKCVFLPMAANLPATPHLRFGGL
ncbi:MBG domain-containing protein [Ancylobacter sp. VNQ12]|uniref:MBG domain-containing protein n=1 Tax=Ancylobacter sp. VNQ12 TaxID=3400920 RepID=UPI003C0A778C